MSTILVSIALIVIAALAYLAFLNGDYEARHSRLARTIPRQQALQTKP